jgi:hypothetical protein
MRRRSAAWVPLLVFVAGQILVAQRGAGRPQGARDIRVTPFRRRRGRAAWTIAWQGTDNADGINRHRRWRSSVRAGTAGQVSKLDANDRVSVFLEILRALALSVDAGGRIIAVQRIPARSRRAPDPVCGADRCRLPDGRNAGRSRTTSATSRSGG